MARWIFVRHAQAVSNRDGWIAGHVDADLTERGQRQALDLGARIAAYRVERAFASDLQRAWRTAELAVGDSGPGVLRSEALRERHLGDWERRHQAELRETGEIQQLLGWDTRPPGGESLRDLAVRVLPWLADIDAPGTTLVVSHGGVLRALLGVIDGTDPARRGRRRIGNTEVFVRELEVGTCQRLTVEVTG